MLYDTPSLTFCLFTQNILRQPIPENSWPCKPFCCGCPYEKKSKNLVLPPSQSTLKYGSENRPWVRGLKLDLPFPFPLFDCGLRSRVLAIRKHIFVTFYIFPNLDFLHWFDFTADSIILASKKGVIPENINIICNRCVINTYLFIIITQIKYNSYII